MYLDEAPSGQRAWITTVASSYVLRRLIQAGVTPGSHIYVVSNHGPTVIRTARDTLIVLGHQWAHAVTVLSHPGTST